MLRMVLKKRTRILFLAGIVAVLFAFLAGPASADMAAAQEVGRRGVSTVDLDER